MKKTVIIGATTNPARYAYIAAGMLKEYDHEIVPVGIKKGTVYGVDILPIDQHPIIKEVDTITLYVGTRHQPMYYEYLLSLKPKRIIFNPGTENSEFEKMVEESGAEALQACTLVLLRSGQY
ncbi:MAG: CoA-binding protein [Cytophagales bacterium]|nr:CoA-binding protein [Cytophagales bacterium]